VSLDITITGTSSSPGGHPDFLDLPWDEPLERWEHPRLVKMAHGISRHVVRFVRYDDRVYALKETEPGVARKEYDNLRELKERGLPTVNPVGVVKGRGTDFDAMLITRYLDFSLPYWYLVGRDEPIALADRLIDAAAVLLVRLHLEHVYWGDCSPSNLLFRRDAGALMAYLVDAETTELPPSIGDGLRLDDLRIAVENVVGGLLNLQAAGRVPAEMDPIEVGQSLESRYHALWDELTHDDVFDIDERWRIERRVRQLNDLGFDVEELSISRDGSRLRIKPILIEEGHHSRELRRRTGLEVQENQARRLLADIESHRAWLSKDQERDVPAAVAAARWLANVYEPVIEAVPAELTARLEPAEVFHQVLEHRYYLSEQQHRQVTHDEAIADYRATILPTQPAERQLQLDAAAGQPDADDG
jgi:hypothetical protein